jgi:hypothetical protein
MYVADLTPQLAQDEEMGPLFAEDTSNLVVAPASGGGAVVAPARSITSGLVVAPQQQTMVNKPVAAPTSTNWLSTILSAASQVGQATGVIPKQTVATKPMSPAVKAGGIGVGALALGGLALYFILRKK